MKQFAQARKYDANLVWHFAELEPNVFALYSPQNRDTVKIGTLDEILTAYRDRSPIIPKPRPSVSLSGINTSNLKFNI